MGIPDMHLRNISLIMRWWWKLYNEPDSIWTVLISRIRWQGAYTLGLLLWSKQGSFFWVQLIGLKHIFTWCTHWEIGNGTAVSFWYDHWGPYPLRQTGSRQQGHAISLSHALSHFNIINLPLTHTLPALNESDDILRWRWTANGQYSANSLYVVMTSGGLIAWRFTEIWKYSIPPSVRVFLFLLLRDKLLTKETMLRRQFNCNGDCVLCATNQLESALHLFFRCVYSIRIWEGICAYLGVPILVNDATVELIWERSSSRFRRSRVTRNRWQIFFSAGCWAIWRQRNSLIFEGKRLPVDVVINWIIREATLWEANCGSRDRLRTAAASVISHNCIY